MFKLGQPIHTPYRTKTVDTNQIRAIMHQAMETN